MINMFIHYVVTSKTIPDSRPKWAKFIPIFRPKWCKNPTRWGGTYLYGLHKGVAPPLDVRIFFYLCDKFLSFLQFCKAVSTEVVVFDRSQSCQK